MNGAKLAVDVLAVYRLTRLVTRDEITEPVRATIEAELDSAGETGWIPTEVVDKLKYVLRCDWCASMYVAAIVFYYRKRNPQPWEAVAPVLAASAVTGLLAGYE
jgi:hypothetical protein